MSEPARISVERKGAVAVVTLERQDQRNVIDLQLVAELGTAFDELEADEAIHAVVVTGRGTAFCAGADLGTLEAGRTEDFLRIYEGFLRVGRSTLPTIAAVNGPAVGAGMNLALCCDLRIVAPEARFISRFPSLGLHPGGGHGWMVMQTGGPEVAAAMLLFGHELRGGEIVDAGLALQVVGGEGLVEAATAFGARAADVPRPLLSKLKETLRTHRTIGDHDEAVAVELEAQAWSKEQPFFVEKIRSFRK
jgi:enoyl-CoA hydratase